MTLSSRRKHRTTRRNGFTRGADWFTAGLLSAALLCCGTALAGADPPAVAGGDAAVSSERPLERLSRRSAQERWQRLKSEFDGLTPPELPPDPVADETPDADPGIAPAASAPAEQPFPLPGAEQRSPLVLPIPDPDFTPRTAVQTTGQRIDPGLREGPSPRRYEDPVGFGPMSETPEGARIVRDPSQMRKITDIQPFEDYEPSHDVRTSDDPCLNRCPRPDDPLCKVYEDPDRIPRCPPEVHFDPAQWAGRISPELVFQWEASNMYHNPLWFEDPSLERYGHTHGELVQPFASLGRFGVQLVGLPYQMSLAPAWRRVYTLGWFRPGEPTPKLYYQIPLNAKAAAVQAAVVTGIVFAIP